MMNRLALVVGAATALAVAPLAEVFPSFSGEAQAQSRTRGKKDAAPAAGGDTTKGMAEAPAVVAAAGLKCSISSASFLGGTKGGEKLYEVACSDGPGYLLIANADASIKAAYECTQLRDGNAANAAAGKADPNALSCKLPQNADPVRGLALAYGNLAPGCTVDAARWLGARPSGENIYELGCAGSSGIILQTAARGATTPPTVTPCIKLQEGTNLACQLTTTEEKLAGVKALVSASDRRTCAVSDTRFMGASSSGTGDEFYEVKCADGAGFVLVANNNAAKRTVGCAQATGIGGGCTLTDALEAQQADAAIYKGLAQQAGFNCDVDSYRLLGIDTNNKREVVELKCKNQPEGAIGFFAAGAGGKTELYDCTKNWRHKQSCSLTKLDAIKPRLTRDLTTHGKSCDVTGFRGAGMTSKGKTEFVEVACAGGPGLMLEYAAEGAPLFAPATGVFTCAEAKNIGEGCKLGAGARTS